MSVANQHNSGPADDPQPSSAGASPSMRPPSLPPPLPSATPRKRFRIGALGMVGLFLVAFLVLFKFGSVLRASRYSAKPGRTEAGVTYRNDRISSEPWSIHVVQIDRSRSDLGFYSSHARHQILGVGLLAEQAKAIPSEVGQAIAGVNGDFYIRDQPPYTGDPRGIQIIENELVSGPSTVCVWFDASGNPHLDEVKSEFEVTWPDGQKAPFGLNEERSGNRAVLYTPTYGSSTHTHSGRELVLERDGTQPWLPLRAGQTYRARVREIRESGNTKLRPEVMILSVDAQSSPAVAGLAVGSAVQISTRTSPDLSGARCAIAGGPAIIQNGKPFALKHPPAGAGGNYSETSKYQRHPRSAIGWSASHVYLVTVDGRQPGLSAGMKLAELAQYMLGLGCTEAMNLDGGKSAQLWMSGKTMNDPCQGEDTVANAIFVVRKPEKNPATK